MERVRHGNLMEARHEMCVCVAIGPLVRTAHDSGSGSCNASPTSPGSRPSSRTIRRVPASGTRSSTGSFATSRRTGAVGPGECGDDRQLDRHHHHHDRAPHQGCARQQHLREGDRGLGRGTCESPHQASPVPRRLVLRTSAITIASLILGQRLSVPAVRSSSVSPGTRALAREALAQLEGRLLDDDVQAVRDREGQEERRGE
jgi:hypothetical protein